MTAVGSKVLQVTNISPSVTMEQLETLFGFLGNIDEMQVFPKTNTVPVSSKVAFVRFQSKSAVETGQHLSNTVFIDKAIICVAYAEGKIPDESVAMQYVAPAASESENDEQHQIPGNVDPNKVEEIKRTIYVGNLDSKTATAEQLLQFFSTCGEVRFVRMAGDETQPTRFAFVEFADAAGVQNALQLNGMLFGDRPIKVNHSNNAIVKPQNKTQETTAKEIEEAMRRVREAQSLISKALEPEVKDRRRSARSRSRHRRHRSRSNSRKRRSTSRSRRRRRSRSRSYGHRSRSQRSGSRSKRQRRSRSRSQKRSKSGKRDRSSSRKKERSKSKSRSRSPSKKSTRHKKDRKRDRERDRDRDSKKRRRRSKSRSSSREGDRKKSKSKDEKNDKETDKKTENGKTEQSKDNGEKEKPTEKQEATVEVEKETSKKQESSDPDATQVTITNGDEMMEIE